MRRLPWLNDDTQDSSSDHTRKRKRACKPNKTTEPVEALRETTSDVSSDTDSEDATIRGSNDPDKAYDAMIPGFEHDDAYMMVEHYLIEAAKQVTKGLHLEAYQKRAMEPVMEKIQRPTTGKPMPSPVIEGVSDEESDWRGKDVSTLGKLLARHPVKVNQLTKTSTRHKCQASSRSVKSSLPKNKEGKSWRDDREIIDEKPVKEAIEYSDDEDDEDLDRPPPKKACPTRSLMSNLDGNKSDNFELQAFQDHLVGLFNHFFASHCQDEIQ